jgi:hypothetical protein
VRRRLERPRLPELALEGSRTLSRHKQSIYGQSLTSQVITQLTANC